MYSLEKSVLKLIGSLNQNEKALKCKNNKSLKMTSDTNGQTVLTTDNDT